MEFINGMYILTYVAELISTFQLSKKRATSFYTKLSAVTTQSNYEQLEENRWLTLGMITLHMYMTLRSVGSIIRKGVTNTINKHHQASLIRGLFVSVIFHVINPSRTFRHATCVMDSVLPRSLFNRTHSNESLADFAILQLI